jgi:hypothetical protein
MEVVVMKVLSPKVHGYLDLAVVALFALGPSLFGFGGLPAVICYAVAAEHLILTLVTAFPMGIAKLVPFPIHGAVEAIAAPLLLASPWLFRFAGEPAARNFFLAAGLLVAAVYILTNYRAAEGPARYARRVAV